MEPITTISTVLSIAKPAGEISKRLFDLGKKIKDREIKQQIDEISDQLRELKQSASELEDQNRELREKLRFKSDDYEFRHPFWYEEDALSAATLLK
jgi:cell shape-determining protein MreC